MKKQIEKILNKYDLLDCEIFEDNQSSDFDFANNENIVVCIHNDYFNVDSMQIVALNCLNELNETFTKQLFVLYRLYHNTVNDQLIITTSDVLKYDLF